ncbi:MAG: hypothetical protein K9L59_01055 [Desulfobacterales bacterium]|nr:hypothetical protein [Desulfobacterales bacterium]
MASAPPSHRESLTSLLILAVLFGIGCGLVLVQRSPNPAVRALKQAAQFPADAAGPAGRTGTRIPIPEGFTAMSPPEVYDPERLADKINGKAELYLSAGVQHLTARRLAMDGDGAWLEVFVYLMESPMDAYAVYSAQYRPGAAPAGVSRYSYTTENALFFIHGPFYVEIVSAAVGPETQRRLATLASEFVRAHPAVETVVAERSLFPQEGIVPDSIELQPADVFGFQELDDVFLARYRFDGVEMTAFLSRRASTDEARELAAAYAAFLERFGGRSEELAFPAAEAYLVEIFGTWEVVFTHGRMLAGVHEAEDRALAELLGRRIWTSLSGEAP